MTSDDPIILRSQLEDALSREASLRSLLLALRVESEALHAQIRHLRKGKDETEVIAKPKEVPNIPE